MRFFTSKLNLFASVLLFSAFLFFGVFTGNPVQAAPHILSTNVPLDSPVYTYLDKLDGLGYLDDIQTGNKPYTRMQVAQWIQQIKTKSVTDPQFPIYAKTILQKLEVEFTYELGLLNGTDPKKSLQLSELSLNTAYYNGGLLKQPHTASHYQPLYTNQNGYRLADGLNNIVEAEVNAQVSEYILCSLAPRLSYDDSEDWSIDLSSGYMVTGFGNTRIQLGKDSLWWGQGQWGNLSLTNNMKALTALKVSNIDPIPLGGILKIFHTMNVSFLYAGLDRERNDVKNPSFTGLRLESIPTTNFTFGGSLNSILGGEGHEVHFSDLWDYIIGKNAETPSAEKWDSIAGFDFRWRIRQLRDMQVYGNFYGEDQRTHPIPSPFKTATNFGFYLPRLTRDGRWDLKVEAAQTSNCWYNHWVYTDGYVDQDHIIGDAMGHNADRYSAQVSYYFADGSHLALFLEHLKMDKDNPNPQTVNSLMVTYRVELADNLSLQAALGMADIDNLNFQADQEDRNYLVSVKVTKEF